MVTASGTGPIAASTAAYMAKSASAIMVGPEIVPPGRRSKPRDSSAAPGILRPTAPRSPSHSRMEDLRKLGGEKALEI